MTIHVDLDKVHGQIKAGARNDALKTLQPWIRYHAFFVFSRVPATIEIDDLIQVGMIAAHDCMDTWLSDEADFTSYAYTRVRGAMSDHLRNEDYLSRSERRHLKLYTKALYEFASQGIRNASATQLAQATGLTIEALRNTEHVASISILDLSWEDANGEPFGIAAHLAGDDISSMDPCKRLQLQQLAELAYGYWCMRGERERDIAERALFYNEELTDIAQEYSLTPSRIHQIVKAFKAGLTEYIHAHSSSSGARPRQHFQPVEMIANYAI